MLLSGILDDPSRVIVVVEAFGVVVAILTLAIGVLQFIRQKRWSFFEKYTARYQHVIEIMPESVLSGKTVPEEDKKQAMCATRLYIDLCSEEFYLRQKRHIYRKVWKEWKEGMKIMFSNPFVKDFFQKTYKKTYVDFANFVENELIQGIDQKTNKEKTLKVAPDTKEGIES